jgi:pimeloyl-ACP methyl ester carboxylesterase
MAVVEEQRLISDDGVALAGSLSVPPSRERAPVVVVVHGAAGGTRSAQLITHLMTFLPTLGVGVVAFDRRGAGDSAGDVRQVTLRRLTADVAAWVRAARKSPKIDPRRVGLWAHSQGAWIAAAVAASDPSVAFLTAISPCGLTPADQMDYAVRERMWEAGYGVDTIRRALSLRAAVNEGYRAPDIDRSRALALIDAARSEPWFEAALMPDPHEPADDSWSVDLDFDVRPALRAIQVPVLAIFGSRDRWIPVAPSLAIWRSELPAQARFAAAVFPEAGHSLTTSFEREDVAERGPLHPAYEPTLRAWLRKQLSR